jgi:hypothetical protein
MVSFPLALPVAPFPGKALAAGGAAAQHGVHLALSGDVPLGSPTVIQGGYSLRAFDPGGIKTGIAGKQNGPCHAGITAGFLAGIEFVDTHPRNERAIPG